MEIYSDLYFEDNEQRMSTGEDDMIHQADELFHPEEGKEELSPGNNEKAELIHPEDAELIARLKAGDGEAAHKLFYEEISGILHRIRTEVYGGLIDYDEMVSELYVYLSENDWARLDRFKGVNRCRLRTWMIPVTWRFFMSIRERLISKSRPNDEHPAEIDEHAFDLRIHIAIDVNSVLERMANRRYADLLRLLLIEGYPPADVAEMMGTKVENIYNIKRRAIVKFLELYGRR